MKDEHNALNDFNNYDIFEKWKKLQNIPTLGMFSVLNKDYNEYMEDLITLNKILADLQKYFSNYWLQMSKTQFQALGNLILRSKADPNISDPNSEKFRLLVIDAFEEAYSSLFLQKSLLYPITKYIQSSLTL